MRLLGCVCVCLLVKEIVVVRFKELWNKRESRTTAAFLTE